MKKILKIGLLPIAFLFVANSTASCSVSPKEIALITDIGDIDDGSFNQESWEACKTYAIANNKTYDFYRPFNDSDFARICSIKQAVAKGAKVIILPGFKFAPACADVMDDYPDVHFLLIDSYVHNGDYNAIDPTPNTCCVGYKCEYSGFIAGYTVAQDLMQWDLNVKKDIDGEYKYGYVGGMATSGVFEFGFGYIQGLARGTMDFCDENSLSSKIPNLYVDYAYAGVFAQSDDAAMKVKSWYLNGDKVVFPCGGKLYQSVTEAAQYYNRHQNDFSYDDWINNGIIKEPPRSAARWVGVDSDQYIGLRQDFEKKTIYTSALKGLEPAITQALDYHFTNEWEKRIGGTREIGPAAGGGEVAYGSKWVLGLNSVFGEFEEGEKPKYNDYVGIPDAENDGNNILRGFNNFDNAKYDKLYEKLIGDNPTILVSGDSGAVMATRDDGTQYQIEGGWHDYDLDIGSGYPYDMKNWSKDGVSYRETYLGKYPTEKITIATDKNGN